MSYQLNRETGKMEPVTTVTGTIRTGCCHLSYDDSNPEHRTARLSKTRPVFITCQHGLRKVEGGAWSGPTYLLFPDPVDRAEFELEMSQERSGIFDGLYADDDEIESVETDVCY